MMGCRYGAKNTLDLNYLYLAEEGGARVFPETKVVDVKPLDDAGDGSAGYEVHTVNSTVVDSSAAPKIHVPCAWSSPLRRWAPWSCSSG